MPKGRRTRGLMSLTWEVKNPASSMATVTLLILTFLCKGLQSQHPGYELKALEAVTVQRGLCVHIPCNFTYSTSEDRYPEELYVYWIKDNGAGSYIRNKWHPNAGSVVASSDKDQSIASFAGNRFQLTGNLSEGDCSFSINDVKFEDEGQYYFRIEKGTLRFSYRVSFILPRVSVTELAEKPKILNLPEVVLGKSITLICQAPGTCPWKESWSQPQISWSNLPGTTTAQNHQHSSGSWTFASGFTFTPSLQDQGRALTCRVRYPAVDTTVANTISLEVVYPPQDIRITRPGHPDISAQEEKLVVREGDTVSLLCEAQGKPIPSVTWLKNNKPLNNNMQGSKDTLRLSNIKSEDAGMYQCQAENPHGSIRKNISVIVQYAPKLSKNPEKNTACWRKDNDILCKCSLHSKPPPQIHWQLDGKTVAENTSTADLKVSSSVQKNEVTSSLIWTGSPDGDLSIICLGNNSLGVYTMQFHLSSLKTASSELIVPLVVGLILMKVLFCFVFFSLAFWYSNWRKAPLTQEGRRKQKE
ncbi:sialic acid-binding Ig-like lectin 5 [Podarcis lilfordi]|nr:sialic acid-binding Ig-like lectin 5 [Podarcis lilfordi]